MLAQFSSTNFISTLEISIYQLPGKKKTNPNYLQTIGIVNNNYQTIRMVANMAIQNTTHKENADWGLQ